MEFVQRRTGVGRVETVTRSENHPNLGILNQLKLYEYVHVNIVVLVTSEIKFISCFIHLQFWRYL